MIETQGLTKKTENFTAVDHIDLTIETAGWMRIVMMACTARGFEAMRRCEKRLKEILPAVEILTFGRCSHVSGFEDKPKLSELTAEWFERADALVFFTAAGIAVRCIAPFVSDKFHDPAVLVVDENTRYVIPLLSGHAGGANRLAGIIAKALDSQPVITTATDGRGLFAVDVFAVENGLVISDRTKAKQISSRLLAGEEAAVFSDCADRADCAGGLRLSDSSLQKRLDRYGKGTVQVADRARADIILSFRHLPEDPADALYLIPRILTLGIGCRKGITGDRISDAVLEMLEKNGIFRQAVFGIASIDLKKNEAGLLAFAKEWQLPIIFYTADELRAVSGDFVPSSFVESVTGVDNVCERSAVLLAGKNGGLLIGKHRKEGVTAAAGISIPGSGQAGECGHESAKIQDQDQAGEQGSDNHRSGL